MLKMPNIPTNRAVFCKFITLRNSGFRIATTMHKTTSIANIPSSFFILLLSYFIACPARLPDRQSHYGFFLELVSRQNPRDLPFMHHRDAVADPENLFHIRAYHYNHNPAVRQLSHKVINFRLGADIDTSCRLIKNNNLRL